MKHIHHELPWGSNSSPVLAIGGGDGGCYQKIQALDLEPIMVKLMDPVEGEGWTLEQVRETEVW